MPLLDLTKITSGLSKVWSGYLRDRDRSLRSGNYPETTRYNYLLAAAQLAAYLREYSPDPDADDAAEDPTKVTKAHVEAFQAWMIDTRSASTALNKHKGLQQFFKWLLLDEEAIDRSPMERVKQPKTPTKLIPIIRDDDTKKVIGTCRGKTFIQLRDEAIIRLYYNTGARLSEVGNLNLVDLDLTTDSVHYHGKGARDRRVRFGPKTARALSRYLRARDKHTGAQPVASRSWRPPAGPEWHQDHAQTPWPGRRPIEGARPPLAPQLRPRMETRRRRPATSCSCSAGPPRTCPATTAPAPPPNAPRKPNSEFSGAAADAVGSPSSTPARRLPNPGHDAGADSARGQRRCQSIGNSMPLNLGRSGHPGGQYAGVDPCATRLEVLTASRDRPGDGAVIRWRAASPLG